jgi:hypothetical protein
MAHFAVGIETFVIAQGPNPGLIGVVINLRAAELFAEIHLQAPRFFNRGFAALTASSLAFFGEEEWVKGVAPVSVQLLRIDVPARPPNPIVELVEFSGQGPLEKLGVTDLKRFPIERIRSEVVDVLHVGPERSA